MRDRARLAHTFSDDGVHTGVVIYTDIHRATIAFGATHQPIRISQDPGRLGDTVTAAWHSWQRNGRPDRSRLGVTAYVNGTSHAWLDTPDDPHRWPLPTT